MTPCTGSATSAAIGLRMQSSPAAPLFDWPAKPLETLRWFVTGYIAPWNAIYALISLGCWLYLTPSMASMQHFAPGWIAFLLVRNALLVAIITGAWHLRLYRQQRQGTSFKYNGQWPSTNNSSFLFKRQNIDNVIWTFASAIPIWTAYEVVIYWLFANHYVPYLSWQAHPIYCTVILLLVPGVPRTPFLPRPSHDPLAAALPHRPHAAS